MKKVYPYSRQSISKEDISSIVKVLKSDFLTQGDQVPFFEKALTKFTKAKYSCVVNSATSGLHLACKALNLKKGDYAWTTTNSFVATANCILHCGANIDFVDIDENDFNISLEKLEKKLQLTPKKKLPKLIIPVHFAGKPYKQKKLFELSRKFKFKIIEDASHAIGSENNGEKIGSCKWSDITVFSFHPVKIITTGEGGAVLTNDKKYFEKIKILRTHGITRIPKKNYYWYYEQKDLGFNFRMSDIHASLGISQLKKINKFINYRNKVANFYKKKLKDLPVKFQTVEKKLKSSYHLFVIKLLNKNNIRNYNRIFNFLRQNKIHVNLHYLPIHLHPFYKKKGFKIRDFKITEEYSKSAISLPIFFGLKKKNQLMIIETLKKALKFYS